jgi:hypothetical protein
LDLFIMNLSIAKLALVAAVMLQGASFANTTTNADMFKATEATGLSSSSTTMTANHKCGTGACGGKEAPKKCAAKKCATKKCATKKCASKKCAAKKCGAAEKK